MYILLNAIDNKKDSIWIIGYSKNSFIEHRMIILMIMDESYTTGTASIHAARIFKDAENNMNNMPAAVLEKTKNGSNYSASTSSDGSSSFNVTSV